MHAPGASAGARYDSAEQCSKYLTKFSAMCHKLTSAAQFTEGASDGGNFWF